MCALLLLLVGCGTPVSATSSLPPRTAPAIKISQFHAEGALTGAGIQLDVSAAGEGYVGVTAQNDNRLKFQVVFGENKYTYDMQSDGTPLIVPLQFGNGSYLFRVMQNTVDDKYVEIYAHTLEVQLADDFVPFLYSSTVVPFSQASESTKKAQALCASATDDGSAVTAIYDYIRDNIAYDYDFAKSAPKNYYANPDATLASGKGICLDYATLAAAMLRSQGIPTKMIVGYVGPDSLYHAWNMFYTAESGWTMANISAPAHQWQRIDITFSATGEDEAVDAGSYTDRYFY